MASVGGEGQAWPLDAPESHTLIVWSREPETIVLPSGEKATDMTHWLWAFCFSVLSSRVAVEEGERASEARKGQRPKGETADPNPTL